MSEIKICERSALKMLKRLKKEKKWVKYLESEIEIQERLLKEQEQ